MSDFQILFLVFSAALMLALTPGPDLMLVIARLSPGRRFQRSSWTAQQ